MKVVLINPPLPVESLKNPVVTNLFYNAMPLGICYLASIMRKNNIGVNILDAAAERHTLEYCSEWIKKEKPDLLGITSTTNNFYQALALAKESKKIKPDMPVIIGGSHVTALPKHALSFEEFDVGVIGEGEVTFLELVNTMAAKGNLSGVNGIIYREGSELKITPPREYIKDLDTIPFPARDLLKPHLYSSLPTDVLRLPKLTMVPTRGCPFHCIFCTSATTGKNYRIFSPEYLFAEIEHLYKDFGAREIAFATTTFTANHKQSEELMELLIKRKLDLVWTNSTRVDTVDKDLLVKMKKAGCWAVRLGIESGNDEVLKFIKKGITKERVRQVAKWCEEIGIHTKTFFMIGHLTDTEETVRDSIEFALSLPIGDVTVQFNTPLPGTAQYEMAKDYGYLKDDFTAYNYWLPAFIPKGLTEEKMIKLHREFYKRFYLRPSLWKRHIKKLIHPRTIINYLKTMNLFFYLAMGKK